jgi:hypothetical protein
MNEPVLGRPILHHFAPDIWLADGSAVRFLGASLPTRMVIVKLGDGSVWINSQVAVSQDLLQEIRAIGSVRRFRHAFRGRCA